VVQENHTLDSWSICCIVFSILNETAGQAWWAGTIGTRARREIGVAISDGRAGRAPAETASSRSSGAGAGAGVTTARQLVPAVDRAMRIMALLETAPQRTFTISDIARTLEIPKSTAFNICGALAEGQMLRRSRDGFQLGRRLVQLGSAFVASFNLVGEFYEVCRAIPLDLRAMVQMAVLDEGFNAVYLGYQDCNSGLRLGLGGGIGRRVPANCTACGKALLAALEAADLEARLAALDALPRLTRRSIVSKPRLMREIAETRDTHYAYDQEETIAGLSCVARAIPSTHADGGFVAVSISASTEALTEQRKLAIRTMLGTLVEELRNRI
jgi:DNA-binding IclR family transcriptional regulator